MKGYKAFNSDLTCRNFQYEIGKTYEIDGSPVICKRGFHFCKSIADCYEFYDKSESTRICEVEALGDVVTDDEVKYCTNKIKIVAEVDKPREKSNKSPSCSGYCNSGDRNSGDWNSGNCNSGDWNSGNCNSGNCNSGDWNSGNCNSGNCNSGDRNSGDWNSGNCNSGDWNSGNCNSGIFNTSKAPTIKIFDKESTWTFDDWYNSRAYEVMAGCPYTYSDYIPEKKMSDEEKEKHPEYRTIGGYIKTIIVTTEDKHKWWNGLPDKDKQAVYDLPNFDAEKFKECTGIEIERVIKEESDNAD